jgi:arsenate reductase-like glutaredoxin family protein
MSTVTVTGADGKKNEVAMLSAADIDGLLSDGNPQSRKQIVEHMKSLGKPVTEIIKMKETERKEWILERYKELDASKPGAAKTGKAAATGKLTSVKASAPAAAAKAAPKAAAQKDDDDDDDAPAASGPSSSGADVSELKDLILQMGEKFADMKNTIDSLQEELTATRTEATEAKEMVQQQVRFLLDVHFITRTCLPSVAGLESDDVKACKDDFYGQLLVDPDEVDEGNG